MISQSVTSLDTNIYLVLSNSLTRSLVNNALKKKIFRIKCKQSEQRSIKITPVSHSHLTLLVPEMKMAEFANNVDLDEEAHNNLQCLPSSL